MSRNRLCTFLRTLLYFQNEIRKQELNNVFKREFNLSKLKAFPL